MGAMRAYDEKGEWIPLCWDGGDAFTFCERVKKKLVDGHIIAKEAVHKYGLKLFWLPDETLKESPEFVMFPTELSSKEFFECSWYTSLNLAVVEQTSTLATTPPKKVAATKVPPSKNDQTQEEYELPQEYTEAKAKLKDAEVALTKLFQYSELSTAASDDIPTVKGTRKGGKERLSDYQKCIQLYVRAVLIELANKRNLLLSEAQVENIKSRMRETADIKFDNLDDDISAEELPNFECAFALAGWEPPKAHADTETPYMRHSPQRRAKVPQRRAKVRPKLFKETCQHFQVVLNRALKIKTQENMWTIRRGFRLTHMKKNSEKRKCQFTDIGDDDEDVLSYCFQVFDGGKTLALPADPQYQYTLALKVFKKWFKASTWAVKELFMQAIKDSCVAIDAICKCKQIEVHFATNQSYRKPFPLVHKDEKTDLDPANVTKQPPEETGKEEVEEDDDSEKMEDEDVNSKKENVPGEEEAAKAAKEAAAMRKMRRLENNLGTGAPCKSNIIDGPRTAKLDGSRSAKRLRKNNLVNQK